MPPRKLGTFVYNGVTVIYDGVTNDKGHSTPIKICPKCEGEKRIGYVSAAAILRGASSGICRSCTTRRRNVESPPGRLKWTDQSCKNGATIHWSQRVVGGDSDGSNDVIPVTHACGHSGTITRNNTHHVRRGRGLCRKCAFELTRGPSHPGWKGGRYNAGNGYIRLTISGLSPKDSALAKRMANKVGGSDAVLEHRLVVARSLGRPLGRGELVHHLNGIKDDNRIENLELVTDQGHRKAEAALADRLYAEIARLQKLLDEAGIPY